MNLTTAEKTLIAIINEPHNFYTQEDKTAILLGIQAIKRCKEARKRAYFTNRGLLPGETKD